MTTVLVKNIDVKCDACGAVTKASADDYHIAEHPTFHADTPYQIECVSCKKKRQVMLPTAGIGKVLEESALLEARAILRNQTGIFHPDIARLLELIGEG